MLNFFAILLIIFIGILLLVLKKRSFKNLINKGKLDSIKSKKHRKNNNQFVSNKKSVLYKHEEKKHSVFYKNSKRNKMISLFQGNTEDKLKAFKIAEELADKSTLSILRIGLRDMSPEAVSYTHLTLPTTPYV